MALGEGRLTRARRVDGNHAEIVKALRKIGCSVLSLHEIGKGAPDLCVGFRSRTMLIELKDGSKSPSKRKLNELQEKFRREWKGSPIAVAESPEHAVRIVTGNHRTDGEPYQWEYS